MSVEEPARLPVGLWVRGHVRRCSAAGVPAVIVHRGGDIGGTVCLKLVFGRLEGCRVLVQQRDLDGRLGWMAVVGRTGPVPEADADAYIDRAVRRDPDLWVVEIEHPEGWHPFEGVELKSD